MEKPKLNSRVQSIHALKSAPVVDRRFRSSNQQQTSKVFESLPPGVKEEFYMSPRDRTEEQQLFDFQECGEHGR